MKLGRLAKTLAGSVNIKRKAKGLLPRPVSFIPYCYMYALFSIFLIIDAPLTQLYLSGFLINGCYLSNNDNNKTNKK